MASRPRDELIALSSIGKPWQSNPGTYETFLPLINWYLNIISLRILFNACPMCKLPFAKGGPSCSVKFGRSCNLCQFQRSVVHRYRNAFSLMTALAFILNDVLGMLMVCSKGFRRDIFGGVETKNIFKQFGCTHRRLVLRL